MAKCIRIPVPVHSTEEMRRPLALRITVILLGLLALLPLAVAALMAVAGSLNGGQNLRLAGVAALLAAWPFWTAVGIAGSRRWGLISMWGLAPALAAVAAFCLRSDLRAAAGAPGGGHPPLEVAYVALLALGVWWVVFFSRRTTRALFG